jgi:hypothetical protein
MSDINALQSQNYIEAENKKHNSEIRQVRSTNDRTLENEIGKGESTIKRLQDDYDTKISNIKNEQEQKLAEIRDKQERTVNEENQRMQDELINLKSTHKQQVAEIRSGHAHEIQEISDSHKKTMAIAQEKLAKEKHKYNA